MRLRVEDLPVGVRVLLVLSVAFLLLWLSYDNIQLRRSLQQHLEANVHLVVNGLNGSYSEAMRVALALDQGRVSSTDLLWFRAELMALSQGAARYNSHLMPNVPPFHYLGSIYASEVNTLNTSLIQNGALTVEEQQHLNGLVADVILMHETFTRELLLSADREAFRTAWSSLIQSLHLSHPFLEP